MKKVNKDNLKATLKLLKEIKLDTVSKKCQIFLPIETERSEELDGFELTIKQTGTASKKMLTPGLVINKDETGKTEILLAYADIDYSPKFDVIQHLEILGYSISKNLKTFLLETECLCVREDYIFGYFSL